MVNDWTKRALCADDDRDLWFSAEHLDRIEAARICANCPVRAECERAGRNEAWGIWGGVSRDATVGTRPDDPLSLHPLNSEEAWTRDALMAAAQRYKRGARDDEAILGQRVRERIKKRATTAGRKAAA